MLVALMLTSVFAISASAMTAGEAAQKVDDLFLDSLKGKMDLINSKVKDLTANFADYMPLIYGVILIALSFFGYKLLKPLNLIGGAYLGYATGLFLYELIAKKIEMPGDGNLIKIILGVFLAIILGLLCTALNKASVIVYMAGHAFYFAATKISDDLIVCVALAVIALVISILLFKYVFIHIFTFTCAKAGVAKLLAAPLVAKAVDFSKFVTIPADPAATVALYLGMLVALLGILTQFKFLRRR